jgi:hypothetical protein
MIVIEVFKLLAPGALLISLGILLYWLFNYFYNPSLQVEISKAGAAAALAFIAGVTACWWAVDKGYFPYKNEAISELEKKLSNAEQELQKYAELTNTCNHTTIENTTLSSLLKTKTADLLYFKDANEICLRNNEIFRAANNQLAQTNSLLQNKVNILEHLNPSDRKVGVQDCSGFFYEN